MVIAGSYFVVTISGGLGVSSSGCGDGGGRELRKFAIMHYKK